MTNIKPLSIQTGDRILLWPEARRKIGDPSRTTVWRMERAGTFPERFEVSPGRIGWLESEINEWIQERAARRKNQWKATANEVAVTANSEAEDANAASKATHADENADAEKGAA